MTPEVRRVFNRCTFASAGRGHISCSEAANGFLRVPGSPGRRRASRAFAKRSPPVTEAAA
jgi:hypothetical protein